jgi:hypothetical protein
MALKDGKHLIKTYIDLGLLHDMAGAKEISFSKHGHVLGLEKYLRKSFDGRSKK